MISVGTSESCAFCGDPNDAMVKGLIIQMKIRIVTFHFPYNCGAVLQCTALQTKLEKMGHEVAVIDYRPWYHQNRYTPLKNPIYFAVKCARPTGEHDNFLKQTLRGCEGFARTVYSWRKYRRNNRKDHKFWSFINRHLQRTKLYRTLKQLQKDPPECDMYISGSDQLWSAKILGGKLDPAYFLNFGNSNVYRMSYAVGADFGKLEEENHLGKLTGLLSQMDAISLREEKWMSLVKNALERDIPIHIDLDPTLLLDAEEYAPFLPERPLITEPYILTYTMPNPSQQEVYYAAKLLGEKLGMKAIDVSGNPSKANEQIKDHRICGPDEFLWYIKNATYVMTNSFHGTAFAVIFQRTFVTIPHTDTGNRVTELLDKLQLHPRWCKTGTEAVSLIETPIDYDATYSSLEALRQESVAFLNKCIHQAEKSALINNRIKEA